MKVKAIKHLWRITPADILHNTVQGDDKFKHALSVCYSPLEFANRTPDMLQLSVQIEIQSNKHNLAYHFSQPPNSTRNAIYYIEFPDRPHHCASNNRWRGHIRTDMSIRLMSPRH